MHMGRTLSGLQKVCNERSCVHFSEPMWTDFCRQFRTLLSFKFREFGSVTALSIIKAINTGIKHLELDSDGILDGCGYWE